MAVTVSPKMAVGSRLREARRRRGLTLEQVWQATRIKPRFLQALERDAPPSAFPAPIYARAFLREYASYVGLNPKPLLDAYHEAHGDPEDFALDLPRGPRRRWLRWLRRGLVLASVATLVGLMVVAEGGRRDAARDDGRRVPGTAAEERSGADGRDLVLRVRVEDSPAFLVVTVDGERKVRGVREPGFDRRFAADRRVDLSTRNAGALRLGLSGRSLGAPGEMGERFRATYRLVKGKPRVFTR